jgi:very-short-patch-repair endonuclease
MQADCHSYEKVDDASTRVVEQHTRILESDLAADKSEPLSMFMETVELDGVCYYKGNDLAQRIGYKDPKQAIRLHVPTDLVVLGIDIGLIGDKNQKSYKYVTSLGILHLIHRSRMPNSLTIAKQLGLPISVKFKAYYHEISTINAIMRTFEGTRMLYQHTVEGYRIDLFFPDCRLAIECDEKDHIAYNGANELHRQQVITSTLDVSWIRYNPDENDFDLLSVINRVHKHMMNNSLK